MHTLEWQKISEAQLARLLGTAELQQSTAIASGTLYQLEQDGLQQIAISLPAGEVVLIRCAPPNLKGRRKVDVHEG